MNTYKNSFTEIQANSPAPKVEKTYSEQDLKALLQFFVKDTRGDKPWVDADDEWFEQFKQNNLPV